MSIIRELARLGNKIDSASAGEFLSKGTSTGSFDAIQYTDLTGRPTVLDSALSSQLIDSSYVQLRQTVSGGGLDSALTTQLIDSSYVSARAGAASSGYQVYEYTATQGQTTFQDSDLSGNLLSYTSGGALVFYNGVLMGPDDITATTGSSVVLASGADSGSHVSIAKWSVAGGGGSSALWYGARGVWAGRGSASNVIDYAAIATPGNATDFGDLATGVKHASAFGDASKGLFAGGQSSGSFGINEIQQITISTAGNASDFGDLTEAKQSTGDFSNGTIGGTVGGHTPATMTNVIEYVTIQTAGNGTDFGDVTTTGSGGRYETASVNNATRAVTGGGYIYGGSANYTDTMDYITMATPGNATDFGNMLANRAAFGSAGNTIRGIFVGGHKIVGGSTTAYVSDMDYITIATTGNATDFGNMSVSRTETSGCSDDTYGVFGGGYTGSNSNVIDYVTIATTANSVDFGDLTSAGTGPAAVSGAAA